jgi:maltose alpha-D-glucosyltransferase/alpha-amylase
LGNNRRKIELLNALLFTLPGTPVIYYGDEIGMGDNIYLGDRNGVRTPMQWSTDRNAGFSLANPQRLYLPIIIDPENHFEAVNVEAQQQNLSSILWWTKRLITLRKRYRAFGRGTTEFLFPKNRRVLVFIRRLEDEIILTVANLSRFVQCVELDLAAYKGKVPVELFGQTDFPPIGDLPYFVTLGPHGFYWFKLENTRATGAVEEGQAPVIEIAGAWDQVITGGAKPALEKVLANYVLNRRWFGGKARKIRSTKIVEAIAVPVDSSRAYFVAVEFVYSEGDPETYLMPLAFTTGERGAELAQFHPEAIVAQLKVKAASGAGDGVLYDAVFDRQFLDALLEAVSRRRSFRGRSWEIEAVPSKHFRKLRGAADSLEPSLGKKEQSNTSITYGDRFILKIVRRLQEGVNPDLEISRFLTEKTEFQQTPALAGSLDLEFHKSTSGSATIGILQAWVRNEGDGWNYTLDQLGDYFENCAARSDKFDGEIRPMATLIDNLKQDLPPLAREMIGPYLATASLLGQRTGELHVALASDLQDPDFAPELVTQFYRRSRYQSLRTSTDSALTLLKECLPRLPDEARAAAALLLPMKAAILARFRLAVDRKITAMRIRCHGDYHLGQVLFTGKDFVIIDFEGEPARPLAQRRAKRSALVDVAGMLRSFDYAEKFALRAGEYREEEQQRMKSWGQYWVYWVSKNFLEAYLKSASGGGFLPATTEELKILLELSTLQKALYELTYELNNRPDWVSTPIRGILEILQTAL